jgi:enterochelin esterase-like enzyme
MQDTCEEAVMRVLTCVLAMLAFACSQPANPVIKGRRVSLLIEANGDDVPGVTGDFTAWKALPARRLPRRGWYQFDTTIEPDARLEYLIAYANDDFRVDPRNPRRVPSVGGEASEIVMPAAESHPELLDDERALAGALEEHPFALPSGTSRRVAVYRPSANVAAMPIVYFHDGSLMIDKGRVPQILDRLITAGRVPALTAVFVDPVSRSDDYKAEPAFRNWFISELVPAIEATLPAAPTSRTVVGVSRGAVAAIDLAIARPDLFNRCGLLIPSTYPTDLIATITAGPAKPVRFAIVAGRYDERWLTDGRALHEALDATGYQLTYREVPEGHNVQTWRSHLDDVLVGLQLASK